MSAVALRKPEMICGILLEFTPLEVALETLSLTKIELETVLGVSSEWPYPAYQDGWKLSHDAIRFDMDAIQTIISAMISQMNHQQRPLAQWQVDSFRQVVSEFHRTVHKHHDHEEEIFFPWMETRVKVPPKMSADHVTLMSLVDKTRDICNGMTSSADSTAAKPVLEALSSTFSQLRTLMRQHLEEEEIIGLPLLRLHFTAKEVLVPEKKIVAQMKPCDMAWLLRPMYLDAKKDTMTRLKVPGLVQRLVMLPAVRKDERTIVQAYRNLAAAGEVGPHKVPHQQAGPAAKPKRVLLFCFARGC